MKRFFRKSNRSAKPRSVQRNCESQFQGCFQQLEDRRLLTVYVVDTLIDDMSGVEDDLISLREAMIAAEKNLGFGDAPAGEVDGDLILFDDSLSGQTIVLTNGEFKISDGLHVGGDTMVVIDADSDSRIFNIDGSKKYLFTNLELTRGRTLSQGGAISMDGGGRLLLTDMLFSKNVAVEQGGAVYGNDSEVMIIASSFNQNRASGENGSGGAIYSNAGHLTLATSRIFGNAAVLSAGGIAVNNTVATISQTHLRNNTSRAGDGGGMAIHGESKIVINDSLFIGNSAAVNGGGFWVQAGESQVVIKDSSSLFNNSANGDAANQGGVPFTTAEHW